MGGLRYATVPTRQQAVMMALQRAVALAKTDRVLFVDCANAFDPYAVLKLCLNRNESMRVLENILVSRPFTIYQLEKLVESELSKAAYHHGTNQVIFSSISNLFLDDDVKSEERKRVFSKIAQWLRHISNHRNLNIELFFSENRHSNEFGGESIWAEP